MRSVIMKNIEPGSDIKIFVSHRIDLESVLLKEPIYYPVRCGAIFDEHKNTEIPGDDTGINISSRRMSFCELTVQYWAWKNVKADYYGLCHYRRYLTFSENHFPVGTEERNNGCATTDYLTEESIEKFGLDEVSARKMIKKYDVIACSPIKAAKSNMQAMKDSPDYHNMNDMYEAINIIKEKYPDMMPIVKEYMSSHSIRLYNCFIMKKEIFFKYSEWLFSILFELENRIDMSKYGIQKFRTPGTIGERLFGIYCLYLSKQPNVRFKNQQLLFIEHPQKITELVPAWSKEQVTIVSNFNNQYASIFSVFLTSLMQHINNDSKYEIVILSEDITQGNILALQEIIMAYGNVKLTIHNPFSLLNDVKLFINNNVYSKDLYVRIIIPYVLKNYNKVIVADADMIVNTDIDELYNTDLFDNYIGAVRDTVYGGYLNGLVPNTMKYTVETLKLDNPYDYCNTGVILMDCKKIRTLYSLDFLLEHINTHQYNIYEQDMINVLFNGKIMFLDPKWNLFTYTNDFVKKCISFAPLDDYLAYQKARKNPGIIHYAAHPKPWWVSHADFGMYFWKYARISPFYEEILAQLSWFLANSILGVTFRESFPRRLSNLLLPKGSRRREVAKRIVPKGSPFWNFSKKIYYLFFKH